MSINEQSVTVANDDTLSALILSAKRRVFLLAPAVSCRLAEALIRQWDVLGRDGVSVVLDVDAEVYRLGYGEPPALKQLEAAAAARGTMLNTQPGIRIGLLIADDEMLVFSPTPQLIEASPNTMPQSDSTPTKPTDSLWGEPKPPESNSPVATTHPANEIRPNAIRIGPPPQAVERDIGQGPNGVKDQIVGLDKAANTKIAAVDASLTENPPQKFDIARKVRVFNTSFEFVEFGVKDAAIGKKKITLPKHIARLTGDKELDDLISPAMELVRGDPSISGRSVQWLRARIAEEYLVNLPGYKPVVLRKNKEKFEKAVDRLRRCVEIFSHRVAERLQAQLDATRDRLIERLVPHLENSPPVEWNKFMGRSPSKDEIQRMLRKELDDVFRKASAQIEKMAVKLQFMGVTYETLNDPDFIALATKKLPTLEKLHREYDAAKALTKDKE